ncbi:MAG: hypothetical protein IT323_11990 [Anaerolineae bacterium]|nr:hypothetical protein [Anaerolineae bacterium]
MFELESQPDVRGQRGAHGQPRSLVESSGGALSVALIGLILALGAALLLPWPTASPDDPPLTTALHYARLAEQAGVGGALPGLVLDAALYVALVIGIGAYVVARLRGGYTALGILLSVGLFGLAYTGRMAVPFVGPLVGLFGFALVVSGAGVAWATYETPEKSHVEPEAVGVDDDDRAGAELRTAIEAQQAEVDAGKRDTGINDDVSYSPA